MVLKLDTNLYKSKNRQQKQNIVRLCVKLNVLKLIAMPLIIEEIKKCGIPECDITSCTKTYVQFALPLSCYVQDTDFYEKLGVFTKSLTERMITTFGVFLKENKDNNLQSMIINLLGNKEYRLKSSVYYSSKHGYKSTFEILDTVDNVWSLRV
jgi:hypothetical protein